MDDSSPQTIYIIAGPNGAGKTTFANSFLPTFAKCREFLNADLIAAGLSPYNLESRAFRASEFLLQRIDELVASHSSFSFETTLVAARSYRNSILNWKGKGYQVLLVYALAPVTHQRLAHRECSTWLRIDLNVNVLLFGFGFVSEQTFIRRSRRSRFLAFAWEHHRPRTATRFS